MKPADLHNLLPEFADGELTPDVRAEIDIHLATHPEHRAEVARWQALRRCATRSLQSEPVPAGLADRIRAGLRSQPPIPAHGATWWIYRASLPGLAVAAVLVLAFTFWSPWGAAATPVEADGFARVYRKCALTKRDDPYRVCDNEAASAYATIGKNVAFACGVPDLTGDGQYHVEGACQCFPSKAVRVVHVYFHSNDGQNRIVSAFAVDRRIRLNSNGSACPICSGERRHYREAADGTVSVLEWDQGERSYAIVGEMPRQDLLRLADGVKVAQLPQPSAQAEPTLAHVGLP